MPEPGQKISHYEGAENLVKSEMSELIPAHDIKERKLLNERNRKDESLPEPFYPAMYDADNYSCVRGYM